RRRRLAAAGSPSFSAAAREPTTSPGLRRCRSLGRRGGVMARVVWVGARRPSVGGMDAEELRRVQTPLKDRYRRDPDAAVFTLQAEGSVTETDISCLVETGAALTEAGLHPATGGDGTHACSGDMLLQ